MANDFFKINLPNDECVYLNRVNIVCVHNHNKAKLKGISVITTDPETTYTIPKDQELKFLIWLEM